MTPFRVPILYIDLFNCKKKKKTLSNSKRFQQYENEMLTPKAKYYQSLQICPFSEYQVLSRKSHRFHYNPSKRHGT